MDIEKHLKFMLQILQFKTAASEETVIKVFSKLRGPVPVISKLGEAGEDELGLAKFENIQEATEALMLVNNRFVSNV